MKSRLQLAASTRGIDCSLFILPLFPMIWLLKTEPDAYSYSDLERDGETMWDGVTQPHALCNLRKMRAGDSAIIYHTGKERAAIGIATVTRGAYINPESSDEKLAVCDVRAKSRFTRAVTLQEIKAHPQLANWDLVRLARLSVVAVDKNQWEILQQLAETQAQ